MSTEIFLDGGVALLVLGLALWVIAARGAFAAVVGFVAFGLVLAVAWVRLAAVDVALTEAAIGGGATGVLLLLAARRLEPGEAGVAPPHLLTRVSAGVLSVAIAAGLGAVVLALPAPAPSLAPHAMAEMPALGVDNPITAVLLAYRSFDTLLEKMVLLVALVGIWSLAPDRFWGGAPAPLQAARPDAPLAFLARVLPPIGLVVGVYEFWVGARAPGGAFQGGTILAAMWVLAMMAGLARPPAIGERVLRFAVVAGPAVFLLAGLAGFAVPGVFLGYPVGFAKPLMIAIEVPMTLSIAAMLAMMMVGPPTGPPMGPPR